MIRSFIWSRRPAGATPTTAMTHLAIQERLDGQAVTWLEKLADADYRR